MPYEDDYHLGQRFTECPECKKSAKLLRETGICLKCELDFLGLPRRFAFPGEDLLNADLSSDLNPLQMAELATIRNYHMENGG